MATVQGVSYAHINFEEYQEWRNKTVVYSDTLEAGSVAEMSYLAMGLAGERGETIDAIKKLLRAHGPSASVSLVVSQGTKENIVNELGDVIWYFVGLCETLGIPPYEVFAANIDKLMDRHGMGLEEYNYSRMGSGGVQLKT